ncbi:MAG: hypothetical protein HY883_07775 [Deltaproteobacteria bacterium]|nr:hypothetical protein [Deltaproteobacteria bacterium]
MRIMRVLKKCLALFAVFMAFSGCSKPKTDEALLRAIVENVASSAREKDVKGVIKHISKDYNDDKGNDYDSAKGILIYEFLRSEKVSVFVMGVTVEVKEERALVNARVVLVRGKEVKSIKDVIPEDASGFKFSIVFRKEDGQWKALSAKWDDTGLLGLL